MITTYCSSMMMMIITIIWGSCVYDRNPGDARVKVGSERKLASSPGAPNSANRGVGEIACFISGLRAEGPSKIGLLIGIFILKKIPISSWDLALHEPNLPMDTRDNERNPRQMMASCLSKLHSDPMFSIALISPLGPHSGSGAVPRTPATPPHSPPLRDRPGDALFCMFRRSPGSTNAKQRTACKGRQCEPSPSETARVWLDTPLPGW